MLGDGVAAGAEVVRNAEERTAAPHEAHHAALLRRLAVGKVLRALVPDRACHGGDLNLVAQLFRQLLGWHSHAVQETAMSAEAVFGCIGIDVVLVIVLVQVLPVLESSKRRSNDLALTIEVVQFRFFRTSGLQSGLRAKLKEDLARDGRAFAVFNVLDEGADILETQEAPSTFDVFAMGMMLFT